MLLRAARAVATVTDVIPTGVTINSVTNPGCTVAGQTVTCTVVAGLAAGGGTAVTLAVVVAGQPITNLATATGLPPDGILLTDADSTVTPVGSPMGVPVPVPGPGVPALILLVLGVLMIGRRGLAARDRARADDSAQLAAGGARNDRLR